MPWSNLIVCHVDIACRLFGPRRKLTNAIARWHSNARLSVNDLEQAYADKLETEMQEMAIQLHQVCWGSLLSWGRLTSPIKVAWEWYSGRDRTLQNMVTTSKLYCSWCCHIQVYAHYIHVRGIQCMITAFRFTIRWIGWSSRFFKNRSFVLSPRHAWWSTALPGSTRWPRLPTRSSGVQPCATFSSASGEITDCCDVDCCDNSFVVFRNGLISNKYFNVWSEFNSFF